jgi:alpha-D-ribose 1-methylphosphonate 5-triphosphate synthase subunit PhnG
MAVCCRATEPELAAALAALAPLPTLTDLRPPEAGLIMLRGKIGGDGQPFNVGEATVARACVIVEGGPIGVGYTLGRSLAKARNMAIIDALGQMPDWRQRIDDAVVRPISERAQAHQDVSQSQTAATRVNFFTLQRGED